MHPAPQIRMLPLLIAACLSLAASAHGQNAMGVLSGVVEDASGARIVAAEISVKNATKSFSRVAQSDARGEFRVPDLPPDTYQLSITANGFLEARADVAVAVSSTREITVSLRPKAASEKVVVRGAASI